MKRTEFIFELERALKALHVADITDITAEYEEHFDRKLADGYTEEEICARLLPPKELAGQSAGLADAKRGGGAKAIIGCGLAFVDIVTALVFIMLYATALAIAALAIASLSLGFGLITGVNYAGIIPSMPFLGALISGIAILALSILSGVGSAYSFLYVNQLARVYLQWHRRVYTGNPTPPLTLNPRLKAKTRRRMRGFALISLAVLGVFLILSFIVLSISAGALEFWHVWGWFVSAA